ncbi:hypothetical protein QFZ74_003881 [Streptomyces sp. V3I7]|nr:hypothetical protein [Streptomyces sp. V3I7]
MSSNMRHFEIDLVTDVEGDVVSDAVADALDIFNTIP